VEDALAVVPHHPSTRSLSAPRSSVLSTPAKQRGNPATELKVSKKAASKDEGPQTKSRKSTRIANRAARVLTK